MMDAPIFLPAIIACLITAIVTALAIPLLKRVGIIDDPKKHKHPAIIHKKPVPRGGGIPIFIGIFVTFLLFLPLTKLTIAIFIASFLALLVGMLDDKLDISPYLRFGINIVTALIVVENGVTIPYITNPLGGILRLETISLIPGISILNLSHLIAIIWIVWVMNMLNWSKGVDGQMPGIVAISSLVIGLLSLRFPLSEQSTNVTAYLSFMITGASVGFLFFNFYPAKIFPGYGATSLYLLLAVASLLSSSKLATAVLVMGIPMTDGIFTVIRRLLAGRSPFWHDKKHLHHILLRFGFSQPYIALFYWFFSAILGALSLLLSSTGKLFAIIMLLVIVGGILVSLHFLFKFSDEKESI